MAPDGNPFHGLTRHEVRSRKANVFPNPGDKKRPDLANALKEWEDWELYCTEL